MNECKEFSEVIVLIEAFQVSEVFEARKISEVS